MERETAMKILKELHDNSLFSNRTALETLIPELADSNDERIRKRLIEFFEDWHENKSHCWGIAVTAILAWLEKQGNNTPTIIWHNIDEKPEEMKELFCEWESDDATWHDVAFYDEESHTFRHAKMPINVTKWVYVDELLEKQGEQKPTDKSATTKQEDEIEIPFGAKDSELIEEEYYIPKGFHAEIDDDKVVIKKGEKSAAWSDEDENYLQSAENACEYQYGKNTSTILWLKSLKERNTWKPSEKQMEALYTLNLIGKIDYVGQAQALIELYNDLKKL